MKVCICGVGVVGGAVADGLERLGHKANRHDLKLGTNLAEMARGVDIAFVCVPSNPRPDGSCDTSIVESVVKELIGLAGFNGIIAIKSTCEPGTTERLGREFSTVTFYNNRICFVPEFLRERSAFYDFTEGHDTLVVGTHSDAVYDKIVAVHGNYPKKTVKLTPTEAELVKYFSNVYNALRITFANGFYDICKNLGADYTAVKNAVVSRGTMKDMYLDCNENFRGFGGVCLPKDSSALASLAKKLGVRATIFDSIVNDNKLYKTTVFDNMRLS